MRTTDTLMDLARSYRYAGTSATEIDAAVTRLRSALTEVLAERDRLRTTIFTDNTQTVVNAEREIERLQIIGQETAAELGAEIERLTGERDMFKATAEAIVDFEKVELRREIERLTLEKKAAAMNYSNALDLALSRIKELEAELENERRKVTELVSGYEKDTATIKELRAQLITTIGQQIEQEPVAQVMYADHPLTSNNLLDRDLPCGTLLYLAQGATT